MIDLIGPWNFREMTIIADTLLTLFTTARSLAQTPQIQPRLPRDFQGLTIKILIFISVSKVLLVTSVGDIDVELWSKEAPKACRNFVQLCMENYYDDTIFHRIVKG